MPTAPTTADAIVRLRRGGDAWARRSHADLADLAGACRRSLATELGAFVDASVAAKGAHTVPGATMEELASGPLPIARFLALVEGLHRGLQRGELPALRRLPRTADDVQAFSAMPAPGLGDRLLLSGCRASIETDEAASPAPPPRRGGVALVLGAGNVTATPLLDVLHQVFLEGRAAVLKASPLHERLVPCFERALAPLVAGDLFAVVPGDADTGRRLVSAPGFTAVHLTGSTATWAAVRASSPPDRAVSAEVGCCTPALVLPVEWRPADLHRVARQLAVFVACNGGATCLAPRVVVTASGWRQRESFVAALRRELALLPARDPFHPGARAAYAAASGAEAANGPLPPTLRDGVDADRDASLFAEERFAPVLLETAIGAADPDAWARSAGAFVRERMFGSLAAYVFAPRGERRHTTNATRALPHGTIAVNCWAGLGYGLGVVPWGVPSGRPWQHGAGWSRGTACVPDPRRVVVEAPLRPVPTPPWLRPGARGAPILRSLTHHYLQPAPHRLVATVLHALRP